VTALDPARGTRVGRHIRKLDHIGIATTDMPAAAALFAGVLGATLLSGGDNDRTGIRLMQLSCGGFKVELMQPLRDDSPISPRLAKYGPGFHHLTFVVDNIVETIDDLAAAGVGTVGANLASANWRECFLAPRQTFGTLLQMVDTVRRWDVPTTAYSIDDVLNGGVVWNDFVDCLRAVKSGSDLQRPCASSGPAQAQGRGVRAGSGRWYEGSLRSRLICAPVRTSSAISGVSGTAVIAA
jgi:methylmalonyl-CoA/ethylmalonyl-CoA epimerase